MVFYYSQPQHSPAFPMAARLSSEDGWKTVVNKPKKKHHFSESQARELERKNNVANLAAALRSQEAEERFAQDWEYDCVVKSNEASPTTYEEYDYCELAIQGNRWKDSIRFRRYRRSEVKDQEGTSEDDRDYDWDWDAEPVFRDCPCHYRPGSSKE